MLLWSCCRNLDYGKLGLEFSKGQRILEYPRVQDAVDMFVLWKVSRRHKQKDGPFPARASMQSRSVRHNERRHLSTKVTQDGIITGADENLSGGCLCKAERTDIPSSRDFVLSSSSAHKDVNP